MKTAANRNTVNILIVFQLSANGDYLLQMNPTTWKDTQMIDSLFTLLILFCAPNLVEMYCKGENDCRKKVEKERNMSPNLGFFFNLGKF